MQDKITASADATAYFSGLAENYQRHRPGYPADAIEHIIHAAGNDSPEHQQPVFADIGSGTGISSRLLAAAGARVIGIEPNADMREVAAALGDVDGRNEFCFGSAEDTGLAEESVDAVVCAQSFHWFDAERALAEFHRITRPRSILVLMWNVRDEQCSAASRQYEDIVRAAQQDAAIRGLIVRQNREGDPETGGYFTNPQCSIFPNPVTYTREALHGRLRSASYFPRDYDLASQLLKQADALFDAYSLGDRLTLAQNCHVTIASRAD